MGKFFAIYNWRYICTENPYMYAENLLSVRDENKKRAQFKIEYRCSKSITHAWF